MVPGVRNVELQLGSRIRNIELNDGNMLLMSLSQTSVQALSF